MACLSGVFMAAFTAGLVIADLWFWQTGRIVPHIFLGGIVTGLFFALCQHGYELVNWSLLGLLAITFLVSLLRRVFSSDAASYSYSEYKEKCPVCIKPKVKCGCRKKKMIKPKCA